MSMHRQDYIDWIKAHPVAVAIVATAAITAVVAALFWNAVL